MKSILILVTITELFALAWGQCSIFTNQIKDERRLVTITAGGNTQILGQNQIPVGATLNFICNANDIVSVRCQSNRAFDRQLPINNCNNPPQTIVEPIVDSECSQTTYRVGYSVGQNFYELYRSCYDPQQVRAFHTRHLLQPHTIYPPRPQIFFSTDGIITQAEANSFNRGPVANSFNALLGQNQRKVNANEVFISRGHLAPSADFIVQMNMADTFKYINVAPNFQSVDSGNWNQVELWARNYVLRTGQADITTGVFEVLHLSEGQRRNIPMYLLRNNRNPIPKWIYKIIRNNQGSFVFVTHNNRYDNPNVAPCRAIACPRDFQITNTAQLGFTFCCDVDHFMANIWPRIK